MPRTLSAARWPSSSAFSHRSSRASATSSCSPREAGTRAATTAPQAMPTNPNSNGLRSSRSISRPPGRAAPSRYSPARPITVPPLSRIERSAPRAAPTAWWIQPSPGSRCSASIAGSPVRPTMRSTRCSAGLASGPVPGERMCGGAAGARQNALEQPGVLGDEPGDAEADQRHRQRVDAKSAAPSGGVGSIGMQGLGDHGRCLCDEMIGGELDRQRVEGKTEIDPNQGDLGFEFIDRAVPVRRHQRPSPILALSARSEAKERRGTSRPGSSHCLPR